MKHSRIRTAIQRKVSLSAILFFAFLFIYGEPCSAELKEAQYLYNLSNFSGVVSYSWAGLAVDDKNNEIYVIHSNEVDIYNDSGMKVYSFGNDEGLNGVVHDVAIAGDGSMFLLMTQVRDNFSIIHCNYRGEPISEVKFRNFPSWFSNFTAGRIVYRAGNLYMADLLGLKKVVITNSNGFYKDSYDMNDILNLKEYEKKPGHELEIVGFNVDEEGNMLMTVPTIFRAFKVSPDRSVQSFGEAGSLPGQFNIVGGIASDEEGNYYVADTLKSTVMVYDKDFKFLMEFGHRGIQPGSLIAPKNLVIAHGNVYVSQARDRGVSVFKIIQK
jgi:DNA-binding beta-propeller fold protein YncE